MRTGVLRQARRRAAVNAYLEAGWPIAPGAWWDLRAEQYRCRRVGCLTSGTIHAADGLTPRSDAAAWAHDPATVLLVTGHGIDVVEVPIGSTPPEEVLARGLVPGPVALWTSARPRLLLMGGTAPGSPAPDGLADLLPEGALLHGPGSYVPLPPSRMRTGDVLWLRSPQALDWRLPGLGDVLDPVVHGSPRPPTPRPATPPRTGELPAQPLRRAMMRKV